MSNMRVCRSAAIGLTVSLGLVACGPDPDDDAFARSFLSALQTQDPAAEHQLEPNSSISAAGIEGLIGHSTHLPSGSPDSVRLVEWERLRDEHGPARKLTYRVFGSDRSAQVELWLVTKEGRTYVNTARTRGLVP